MPNSFRDFSFFIQTINSTEQAYFPRNDHELVAKTLAYFYTEVVVDSVSDNDMPALAKIFAEHFQGRSIINQSIDEYLYSLLHILVDNDKLGLRTIFNDEEEALSRLNALLIPYKDHFAHSQGEKNTALSTTTLEIPTYPGKSTEEIKTPLLFNTFENKKIKKCEIAIDNLKQLFPEKNLKHAKEILSGVEFKEREIPSTFKLDYLNDQIILGNELNYNQIFFELTIDYLQVKPQLLRSDLFKNEDFIVFLSGGFWKHSHVQIKLGNLFIDLACQGKGAIGFDIYYIDNKKNGLISLITCAKARSKEAIFPCELCLPFSPLVFGLQSKAHHDFFLPLTRSAIEKLPKNRQESHEINNLINLREIFLGLSLGRTTSDFPNLKQELKAFYDVASKSNLAQHVSFFKPPALAISSLTINEEITNEHVDNQKFGL